LGGLLLGEVVHAALTADDLADTLFELWGRELESLTQRQQELDLLVARWLILPLPRTVPGRGGWSRRRAIARAICGVSILGNVGRSLLVVTADGGFPLVPVNFLSQGFLGQMEEFLDAFQDCLCVVQGSVDLGVQVDAVAVRV